MTRQPPDHVEIEAFEMMHRAIQSRGERGERPGLDQIVPTLW
jgi:hypothetical protein